MATFSLMTLLAALLIGLALGLFGSGGSILTVPLLIFMLGLPEKLAVTTALGIVALISLGAVLPYLWRRQIATGMLFQLALPGMAGAMLGGRLSEGVPAALQMGLLALLMMLASVNMWRTEPWRYPLSARWQLLTLGFMLGVLTGLIGVGGGFLLVPLLLAVTRLATSQLVATSLALVFLQSATGFASHLWLTTHAAPDFVLILTFGLIGAVGSLGGLLLLRRLPQLWFRRSFALFLPVLALALLLQQLQQAGWLF